MKTKCIPAVSPQALSSNWKTATKFTMPADTGVFGDIRYIAAYYQPDLALLTIGGHYTMDPEHAAYAVKNLLKTETVIPMHYGTFPPLKGTPEAFKKAPGKTSSKVIRNAAGGDYKILRASNHGAHGDHGGNNV